MKKVFYSFLFVLLATLSPTFVVANSTSEVVLKDEVFDFSITSNNDLVEIVWENVPKNTSEIIIERSFDGKRYTSVYRTNNTVGYTFQDDLFSLPVQEVNYRFKFLLKDGSEVFSNSKFLSLENKDHLKPTIFANGGQILFEFYSSGNGMVSAQIFNSTANLIAEDLFETESGDNSLEMNVYDLRRGLYFLRLEMNGKTTTTKFFVR